MRPRGQRDHELHPGRVVGACAEPRSEREHERPGSLLRRQEIEDLKKAQEVQVATGAGRSCRRRCIARRAGLAMTIVTGSVALVVGTPSGGLTNTGRLTRRSGGAQTKVSPAN